MFNRKNKILIIEDDFNNRKIIAQILRKHSNYKICTARNSYNVLKAIEQDPPDLILLDVILPDLNGFELAKILKKKNSLKKIPIIFLTVKTGIRDKLKGFSIGGVDFITKPFNKFELLARIDTHIRLKNLQDELETKNKILENRELHLNKLVEERTVKTEKITFAMIKALENANYYNDSDTGNHLSRVSEYSVLLAEKYGCDINFIKRLKLYMPLHDIGKIGIPDRILKKPGKYMDEEFKVMQNHVVIGSKLLESPEIDDMAKNIVLYHHERWDGTGYVYKLKGEQIPLEARIAALSDVFDALITKRVYKDAYSLREAEDIIFENSGHHFEPKLVNIFKTNKKKIVEIMNSFN